MSAKAGDNIVSLVWGNDSYPVTQEFGTYDPSTAGMYGYAADVGWPAGTHVGLDVRTPKGTPIFAAESGDVIAAGMNDYFRPMPVMVKEEDGDTAIYGHLWTNDVNIGDKVQAGQQLGTSGEQTEPGTFNPDGTGAHIHFELRNAAGKAIDPTPELTGAEGSLIPNRPKLNIFILVAALGLAGLVVWKIAR